MEKQKKIYENHSAEGNVFQPKIWKEETVSLKSNKAQIRDKE